MKYPFLPPKDGSTFPAADKRAQHLEIIKQMKEFKRGGGKVKKIPIGVSGQDPLRASRQIIITPPKAKT